MPKNRRMPASAAPRSTVRVKSFAAMAEEIARADRDAAARLRRSAPLRNARRNAMGA